MATITNLKPRLLWGLKVPGHKTPQWLPGPNPLDPKYWDKIKHNTTIQKWVELGFVSVDLKADAPDPLTPPTAAELAAFTDVELRAALGDPNVPAAWHTKLEAELAGRTPPPAAALDVATETDVDKLIAFAEANPAEKDAVDSRLAALENDS